MSQLNGAGILAIIEEICSFGPRWMGSPGAGMARDYIARQFRQTGLEVELQPFRYLSYVPDHATLMIEGRKVPCEPIALAPSTPEPVKAPLAFAGQCSREDLAPLESRGVSLRDSIVVSNNLRSFVAYPLVQEAGALGFISLTNLDGNTIRCGCARLDRNPGTLPAVSVGGDDGRWITEQLESGKSLQATLETLGRVEDSLGHNVIGVKAGGSKRKILVTAHYDSFWNGVHAMDNASGTAAVIALNRALASLPDASLEFVVFGGEELGLWGSASYVEQALGRLDDILAIVNLDTFGSSISKLEIGATADLLDFLQELTNEAGIEVDCWNCPPRAASDQQPFVERGVPAVWLANCGADQRYHTPLDLPAQMSAEKLEAVATLAERIIRRLIARS